MAATACLLLGQLEGGLPFESVVPGCKAALESHDAFEKCYPGDILVEAATNPAFKPPTSSKPQGSGSSIGSKPVVSPCERPFLTHVNYTGANHCPEHAANFAQTSRDSLQMREGPSRPLSWDFLRTSREFRANLYSIFV